MFELNEQPNLILKFLFSFYLAIVPSFGASQEGSIEFSFVSEIYL